MTTTKKKKIRIKKKNFTILIVIIISIITLISKGINTIINFNTKEPKKN